MVTLTIQPPGASPVAHLLKDETITIGRMSGNTIVINDISVSLVHARITRKNGEFFVKDLNSTNGTMVNGQPVTEARLRDRDVLRFADIGGQFNADVEDLKAALPALGAIRQLAQAHSSQTLATLALRPGPARPDSGETPPPLSPIAPSASRPGTARRRVRFVPVGIVVGAGVLTVGVIEFGGLNLTHRATARNESAAAKAPATVAARPPASGTPPALAAPKPQAPAVESADQLAPDLPRLIKALQDPDPAERRQAVAELHSLGPTASSATPALHQALSDPDQEVRLWAALALINVRSYDKAIPPILIHVLHDDKPMVRQLACVSLGLLPYEPAEKDAVVPALIAAANNDGDEDVRKAAIAALGVIDPEGVGKTVIK